MKPTLVAFNPFLSTMGGGEKYFFTILGVLQQHFFIKLVNPCVGTDIIGQVNDRFHIDLSAIEVLPFVSKSVAELQDMVPTDAVFFQFSNGVPLLATCQKTILHQQTIFSRFDRERAQKFFPQQDLRVLNEEVERRFAAQDHIFFPSHYVRDAMLSHWPVGVADSSVVYPPVGDIFYRPDSQLKSGIISVGRFAAIKCQEAQIKLMQSLHMDLPEDCRLTIAGSSRTEIMDKLVQAAAQLPVDILHGLDPVALRKEYGNAAVFWSTTGLPDRNLDLAHRVETFGLAIAESMASGCVPVAIKAGGVTEIIDSGDDGYLVTSLQEMGEVTEHLFSHRDELARLSERAKEKARTYSTQMFEQRILELFL